MVAHRVGMSAGIFWMNPSETWIDIVKSKATAAVRKEKIDRHFVGLYH